MSKATSYTLNDRMELAGPTIEEQCAEAVARMERYGVVVERISDSESCPKSKGGSIPSRLSRVGAKGASFKSA